MKNIDLFKAPHICLTALDADADAKTFAAWTHDSRFIPLIEDDPLQVIGTRSELLSVP